MVRLEKLKKLIESGVLLSKNTFIIDDIDSILDSREEIDFDDEWVRNYNAVNEKKDLINTENKKLIDSIREISFKVLYNATESPDLAGYVSDDFGLIAEALIINYNDEWLNALAKTYLEGKIPHGNLNASKGELSEIILG